MTLPSPEPFAAPLGRYVRRWAPLVPIVLSLAMLAIAFAAGVRSGVSGAASTLPISRVGFSAVISSKVHGLEGHPYSAFESVDDALATAGLQFAHDQQVAPYLDPQKVNAAFGAAESADTCASSLMFWGQNDQGTVDFTRGAFSLFGTKIQSLYYFFFVLFSASIIIFLISFSKDYNSCLLLFGCIFAVYTFLPSYLLGDADLLSVANYRFATCIAIIPLFHIMILLWRDDRRLTWPALLTAIAQMAIISFAYAIRSTTLWMFIAIAILFALLSLVPVLRALRLRSQAPLKPLTFSRAPLVVVFLATILSIGTTRQFYMVPPCGTALNAHPFWHNVFLGLDVHDDWGTRFAAQYENAEGDQLVFTAAKLYAERHHLPYQTEPTIWVSDAQTTRTTVDTLPFGSWVTYEKIVRAAFFEFVREHPRFVAEDFLFYKPLRIYRDLVSFLGTAWHDLEASKALLFMAFFVILAATGVRNVRTASGLSGGGLTLLLAVAFVAAASPLIVAYSGHFLITDEAFVLMAAIVVGILHLMRYAIRALFALFRVKSGGQAEKASPSPASFRRVPRVEPDTFSDWPRDT